jgi:beta-lactamase regulating signal transducer with metallopeptidase domain
MIEQINALSITWWRWMSGMFWQVSLLIILISGIDLLLRRWVWPQVRYALWFMVLIKLLLPPTIASPVSITANFQSVALKALGHYQTEQTSVNYYMTPVSTATAPAESISILSVEGKEILTKSGGAIPKTKVKFNWQGFAMFLWLFVSLAMLILLIKKFSEIRKAKISGERKVVPDWFELILIQCARRLKLQVIPNVVITKMVSSPAIFGMIRPVLLLPTDFLQETSKKDTENILLHELAHIKRRDLLVKEIETFLTIIYWFNPLFWGAKKQLQHLRELCCDSTVANILQRKVKSYRSTLLATARRLLAQPLEPGLGFLGLFEDSDRISARLKWLEKGTVKLRWLRNTLIFAIFIFVPLCILPMSRAEFDKTLEAVTELEEKITGEIDKIEELLAEFDLLKEKLVYLHEQIEKINDKEIDSLEKILNKKTVGLENRIKDHLWTLKKNEKELKEWSKDMKKWEGEDLKRSTDSLFKSLRKVFKDSLYIKLPMLKIDMDSILSSNIKFDSISFPFDSFTYIKIGSDSVLLPVNPSIPATKIIIDSLSFPPNPLIRIDTSGIPCKSLAIIEFGPDSAPILSMAVPKYVFVSSSWPCSLSASEIDIDFYDKDSECKSYKHHFSSVYDIKKGSKLQIYNHDGKVKLSTWNKNKVKVVATITTKNPEYKDENQFIEVKTGSPMIIKTKDLKDISVAYEIKVPRGTKVEKVTNSNGEIKVDGTKGPIYLSSSNGMIVAGNIDGDIIAETSNGKIDIVKAGFVKAATSNAAISLRNVEGIEKIETSNGNIYSEIHRLKSDYTNIETSNANIELRLSKNLNAELRANTSMGKIDTREISKQQGFEIINRKKEMYLKAKVGKGGRQGIDVRTSNGNINIKSLW